MPEPAAKSQAAEHLETVSRCGPRSPGLIATPLWAGMTDDKREAMFVGAAQHLPSRRVGQPEDIANAVLFLATRSFATGLNAPPASALWKMSLAANHRISLDLDLGVRNRQRSNGD